MVHDSGAVYPAEREVEAEFQLVGAGFACAAVDTCSSSQAPVEAMVYGCVLICSVSVDECAGVAFIFDTITYLRAEVEEPSPLFATEIKMHQERQFHIMEAAAVPCVFCFLCPSAMNVVELHLQGAVFMSRVAEDQTTVSSQYTGVVDRRHVRHFGCEDDTAGTHATVYTETDVRCL